MKTRIKQLRQEKHFTQEFLAGQIGANQAALSKIECGVSVPDAELIVSLAEIFQVSADYILYLSEHRDTVDDLLRTNFYNLKEYEKYIFTLQKFSARQKISFQNLMDSIIL